MKLDTKTQNNLRLRLNSFTPKAHNSRVFNSFRMDTSRSPDKQNNEHSHKLTKILQPNSSPQPKSKDQVKSKQSQTSKHKPNRSTQGKRQLQASSKKVQQLLKGLFEKHEQMKKKIEKLKRQKEAKERQELQMCTFTPQITKSPRFRPQGTFLQRQTLKLELRENERKKRKLELTEQQIKECSFRPSLVSKEKSSDILLRKENKEREKHQQAQQALKALELAQSGQIFRENKSKGEQGMRSNKKSLNWVAIKQAVKFQLQNIEL